MEEEHLTEEHLLALFGHTDDDKRWRGQADSQEFTNTVIYLIKRQDEQCQGV